MAISGKPKISKEAKRRRRLELASKSATWWIVALGALALFTGDRWASLLGLRYVFLAEPILRQLGICYLALGIYLRRSLDEPENRYFTVDLLTLFYWAQVIAISSLLFRGWDLFSGEKAIFAVNLGFALALLVLRTKSSAMAEGAPEAKDAKEAARETIARLKSLLEEKKRVKPIPLTAGLPSEEEEAAAKPEDPNAPKRVSEAQPHMD
jgi:hypothetical protein